MRQSVGGAESAGADALVLVDSGAVLVGAFETSASRQPLLAVVPFVF